MKCHLRQSADTPAKVSTGIAFLSLALLASTMFAGIPPAGHGYLEPGLNPSPVQTSSGQTRRTGTKSRRARTKPKPEKSQAESSVILSASEVLVDAVVRDRKGRPVKDLKAPDFQIFEDGKKQQVESVRFHEGETDQSPNPVNAESDSAPSEIKPDVKPSGVNVVALVFDGLSPSGRRLAQKSALQAVAEKFGRNDFGGVFSIDLTLRILQPFTNNRELITKAINQMAATNSNPSTAGESALTADAGQYLAPTQTTLGLQATDGDSLNPAVDGTIGPGDFGGGSDAAAAAINANVVHSFQTLERNQRSHAEIDSMRSIINSLRYVEGRKAIVLFSEGVTVASGTASLFRGLIQEARGADVTFYTIDAGGLRAISPIGVTAKRLNDSAMNQAETSLSGGEDTSGRPMSYALEDNESLLYSDPSVALTQLADQTGGLFIDQTNDLMPGLARIGEDIRSYYVLTYSPLNLNFDGRFRQIAVKVDRPGVKVEARKGYYATAKNESMEVPDWEAPAISVLKGGRSENSLAMRARVYSFPNSDQSERVPILVEAPANDLTFEVDKTTNNFKTDFSVVAVIKDLSDQIIGKVGDHYQISGTADKLEATKHGNVEFEREVYLPPGLYFVEAAVYDAPSGKSSVRQTSIEVPFYGSGTVPQMSSLVLVRSAGPLPPSSENESSPFRYDQALLSPNMGEALSRGRDKELSLFVDVYPGKGSSPAPKFTVEILRNGKVISRGLPALPAADSMGRIQYSGALPLASLKVGDYLLRVTLGEGKNSISRSAGFTVQP